MAKKNTKKAVKKAPSTTAKKTAKKQSSPKPKTKVDLTQRNKSPKTSHTQPPSHQAISERAYLIYLDRVSCGKEGCCETDWQQACEELS